MGIHGEPGISSQKMMSADDVAQLMFDRINREMSLSAGDEVVVELNGLGSTPIEELYIIYRKLHQILEGLSVRVFKVYIGEFATSMEMGGFSMTLMKLDDELKRMVVYPANTPFFTNFNK